MRDPRKKVIAIDFDGVLNPYVPGTADVLRQLKAKAKLVVFTARRDHDFVREVLQSASLLAYFEAVTSEKGHFDLIVDDLPLVQFTGDWEPVLRAAAKL